jgi:hypothetical protein
VAVVVVAELLEAVEQVALELHLDFLFLLQQAIQ